jgi:IPT/TIG domain.
VGGDWHLPTIDELRIFTDAGYRPDTLATAGFTNVQAYLYWSSSTSADLPGYAWVVNIGSGFVGLGTMRYGAYVWPVRAGQYWAVGPLVTLGNGDFGNLAVGSASPGHQFTVKNAAASDQPVLGIALSGTDTDQFGVTTGGSLPCSSLTPTLAAGASCTVLVTAAPTSVGIKNASLTVTTAAGSTAVPLTATASYPVPTVTGISPSSGFADGGTTVTITGTGLSNVTAVKFASTNATAFTTNSATLLTATSPTGLVGQTVDITVTTPGGTSATSSADQFTYTLQYQAQNQSTNPIHSLHHPCRSYCQRISRA